MKKQLTALAACAFVLGGCSAAEPELTSSTPTTTFGAAGAAPAAPESELASQAINESSQQSTYSSKPNRATASDLEMMVASYKDEGVAFPRSHAERYAEITCEAAQEGLSPIRIADMWSENVSDFSVSDHYILTGAAIGAYCPEQMGLEGY